MAIWPGSSCSPSVLLQAKWFLVGCISSLSLFSALTARAGNPSAQPASIPSVIRDSALVIGNSTTGPYFLSGYFIVIGSEKVTHRSLNPPAAIICRGDPVGRPHADDTCDDDAAVCRDGVP